MNPVKRQLISRNGLFCMLCGKEFKYDELNWHHIKPKAVTLEENGTIDNTYENGAILCYDCHHFVHTFDWGTEEYTNLMDIIRDKKI